MEVVYALAIFTHRLLMLAEFVLNRISQKQNLVSYEKKFRS